MAGRVGSLEGEPPSNVRENVAVSPKVIGLRSRPAVTVTADEAPADAHKSATHRAASPNLLLVERLATVFRCRHKLRMLQCCLPAWVQASVSSIVEWTSSGEFCSISTAEISLYSPQPWQFKTGLLKFKNAIAPWCGWTKAGSPAPSCAPPGPAAVSARMWSPESMNGCFNRTGPRTPWRNSFPRAWWFA